MSASTPSNPGPDSTQSPSDPASSKPHNATSPVAQASGETGTSSHASQPSPAGSSAPQLNPRSCVTCRRRKVRCDKRHPCSNCTKAGIDCVFPGPGRAPRKSMKPPDTELLLRLRRLESVVQTLGAQVDEDGNALSQSPVASGEMRADSVSEAPQKIDFCDADPKIPRKKRIDKEFGRLVIDEDRSRYVSNQFWASLSDEVAEMRDLLDEPSSDEDDYPSPEHSGSGSSHQQNHHHQGFIFGYSSLSTNLRSLHPTPTQLFTLWEIYKENVDPLVKILHRPSMRKYLLEASSNLDGLNRSVEAMLFSIYHAAVTSLSQEQCLALLGEDRDPLLDRYRFAVEQSLSRAGFLNSASMTVLQAFVLFLICVRRQDDTRFVWTLTGLAIRLAQAIGIHRDGTNFNLSPFETEMRRRLWWHICILDARSSEDHGTDPSIFEQFYDSRLPLNINDEDISPESTEPPVERVGCTEMTFCLIRFEVSVTVRRLTYVAPGGGLCPLATQQSLRDQERLIDTLHQRLEERYLQYCDMSVPIYWVTATVARLIMAKMWLVVHHPLQREDSGQNLPQDTRDRLFLTSVEVIEFSRLLETHESTKKWGWLFRTYMQWHAVAFVLSELCIRPRSAVVERAWRAVESVYDGWDNSTTGKKGMLWRPMRKLMIKARAFRAQQVRMQYRHEAVFPQSAVATTKYPNQASPAEPPPKTMGGLYAALDATFTAFGLDPTFDPKDTPPYSKPNPGTDSLSSNLPPAAQLPEQQQPPQPNQPFRSSTLDSNHQGPANLTPTPTQRNLSNEDINHWLVQDLGYAGGVGQIPSFDPMSGVNQPTMRMEDGGISDPSTSGEMTGMNDGDDPATAMDWTGWNKVVKDFQMDMQQVGQMNGQEGGLMGPTMGDITDWW